MKKLKRPFIVIVSIVSLVICYTLTDRYKTQKAYETLPNIYEIPKTSSTYTNGDCTTFERHYIIKNVPEELDDLKLLIHDYIYENHIIEDFINHNKTPYIYVSLDFYRISEFLPFDFEENPGFGGTEIDDRRDDCIAYICLFPKKDNELLYVVRKRTPNDNNGYSDVIEEINYYEEID